MRHLIVILLCALVGHAPSVLALEKRPMTLGDIFRIKTVSEPQVSPDGKQIAFIVREANVNRNTYFTNIWTLSLSGDEPRRLTDETGNESVIRWSPDNQRLAFFSTKEGGSGIWVMNADGSRLKRLTRIRLSNHEVGSTGNPLAWSPDGKELAYVAAVDALTPFDNDLVRVYRRALFRSDFGISDGLRRHVFLISADGGQPRQITEGPYDVHSIAWSPDGKSIACVSNQTGRDDDNHNNDLCVISVGDGKFTQLTRTPGAEYSPVYSLDGKWIAYLGRRRPHAIKDSNPEDTHLWVMRAGGGLPRNISLPLDNRVNDFEWSPDSKRLYFTLQRHGMVELYRASLRSGTIETVRTGRLTIGAITCTPDGEQIIYHRSTEADPGDLWIAGWEGSNPRPLTSFNKPLLDEVWFAKAEAFWFESFDGQTVQGFLLKPYVFRPSQKYPMILIPRGGPHGQNGHKFRFTFQMYPANGYVALLINYRGSTGYGQRFADADYQDLLGGDYRDLMAGVDFVLTEYSFVERDRLGVTGGSYGGYLTNWIITQTDRFKAAIPMASISNMVSYYGTASNQLWTENELAAKFWENWELYRRTSPLTYVRNVRTPTFFIQGEQDHTCPVEQAEEMFLALKKLRVPSVLVVYPNEGHSRVNMRPKAIQDYYHRTFLWMDYYVQGKGSSPLP